MALRRWEPWDFDIFPEIESLHEEIDRLFTDFLSPRRRRGKEPMIWQPRVDLYETENDVILKAELPGIDKKDLEVTVTEDSVHIKGEKKEETEVKKENYYRKEISFGKFERIIPLPVEVEPDKADAKFDKGILEIKIPKKEEAKKKVKKIEL